MTPPTHADLWRMAIDEGRQRAAPEDQEAGDGLGMADEDGAIREADCVCPYGNDVCDCPKNVEGNR